jgi:hypothetical protein
VTLQIGCASPNYTGPAEAVVFWDKLFGTFMFAPPAASASLKKVHTGQLVRASGKSVAQSRITVEYHGHLYHTVTDRTGNYSVYSTDTTSGIKNATVIAEGHQVVVPVSPESSAPVNIP